MHGLQLLLSVRGPADGKRVQMEQKYYINTHCKLCQGGVHSLQLLLGVRGCAGGPGNIPYGVKSCLVSHHSAALVQRVLRRLHERANTNT